MSSDHANDLEILEACKRPGRIIAAWGNDGELEGRGEAVRVMLRGAGVHLWHLGFTKSGQPKHPLARGKSFIPYTREPEPWL